ncbi:MAG: radical SAM protein [Spirochaetota bacterium]|nr:MAG: radical SAM protein [Spirochaetota bacterium]
MLNPEKVLNRKLVRNIFHHYGYKAERRIDEIFGAEKEKSISAFFGRLPLQIALNAGMRKLGINKQLKESFFSAYHNRQTIVNVFRTIANNGLNQPFRFDGPALVVWNYTSLCNLRCRHCYQSAGNALSNELSFEERIDIINQLVDANVAFIAFSGGEPIMGERFWDVLEYTAKFLHITIATNGTLLEDKSLVDRLADNGVKNVFVSIDGATDESHDFIRGRGSFERTIRGIQNLVANPHLHVGINSVITQRNFGEAADIIKLAGDLGVNSFTHYNFIPTGRGSDDYKNDLSPEQREQLLNILYEGHVKRKQTKLNMISTAPQYCRVLYESSGGSSSGLFHYTTDGGSSIRGIVKFAGGCGAGRVYAAIQPNGKVSPCVFMPQVEIGDLRREKFGDIWRNSELCEQLSDRENYHYKCNNYRYVCGGCRARALAYGDILGGDPGCLVYKRSIKRSKEKKPEQEAVTA